MSVEENGDGSVARLLIEYELKYGPLGALMDRMMVRRQFSKIVPAVLRGLKRHMERTAKSRTN